MQHKYRTVPKHHKTSCVTTYMCSASRQLTCSSSLLKQNKKIMLTIPKFNQQQQQQIAFIAVSDNFKILMECACGGRSRAMRSSLLP